MMFSRLSADKVNSVHGLFLFLHRLKVIGTVSTKTVNVPLTEFGRPSLYSLIYEGYDRSTRGVISPEDRLKAFFNRVADHDEPYNEQLE